MRIIGFILVGLFIKISLCAQKREIELEPRVGFSLITDYDNKVYAGYTIGGMVSVPITNRFFIQPGLSFLSTRHDGINGSILLIPVYASYRIPLKDARLRLNAGPYGQLGDDYNLGVSVEVGIDYERWFAGIQAYQNLLDNMSYGIFGVSMGYKFRIQ